MLQARNELEYINTKYNETCDESGVDTGSPTYYETESK